MTHSVIVRYKFNNFGSSYIKFVRPAPGVVYNKQAYLSDNFHSRRRVTGTDFENDIIEFRVVCKGENLPQREDDEDASAYNQECIHSLRKK